MNFECELSVSSISALCDAVRRYRDEIAARLDEFCRRLAEIGMTASQQAVRLDTGNLAASIRIERDGDAAWLVITDEAYAAFVEFGTGVVGEGTYEGALPPGYGYDLRMTPDAHDEDDPTIWYYYDEKGHLRSTRGQVADGYMLAGSEVMRQMVLPIAKEVFGRD